MPKKTLTVADIKKAHEEAKPQLMKCHCGKEQGSGGYLYSKECIIRGRIPKLDSYICKDCYEKEELNANKE